MPRKAGDKDSKPERIHVDCIDATICRDYHIPMADVRRMGLIDKMKVLGYQPLPKLSENPNRYVTPDKHKRPSGWKRNAAKSR